MFRIKRHKFISLLTACILLLCLTACGVNTDVSKQPTSIDVWTYYNGEQLLAFNSLVQEFNTTVGVEHGIIVTNSSIGDVNDLASNVLASAAGKVGSDELPNIFAAYADTALEMTKLGLAADLSPYLTQEERESYVDSYIQEGDFYGDGTIRIFPVAKATEVMLLNKTDWDRFAKETGATYADISTIEGIVATAQLYYEWTDSLTPESNDGKALFGRDAMANYFYSGFMQLNGELFTVDGDTVTINFDKDVARVLWDNEYIPFIKGYFAASGRFRSDDIKTGNILMYIGSSSSATFFPKEVVRDDTTSYPIEMEAFPCAQFETGAPYAIQQGAGMVVVDSSREEVEASVLFLKWLAEEEQNIQFSVGSGYLPVKKTAYDFETVQSYHPDMNATVEKVLRVSIETVNENTMYTAMPFEKGEEARKILEYSLRDFETKDRAIVVESLNNGVSPEQAVEKFVSDEYFELWYQQTLRELTKLTQTSKP